MINKTVFRCVVLRLQSAEQSFFSSENLDSTGGMFGKIEQATSVADKTGTDKLSNESCQIGCNGTHTVPQVFSKLCSVLGDRDDLVA